LKPFLYYLAQTNKEITWYNLYLLGKFAEKFELISLRNDFFAWVNELLLEFYPNEHRVIISFGFIHSPTNATHNQPWHIDYGPCMSNIFVPMCELSINNSTQFIRGAMPCLERDDLTTGSYNYKGGPNEFMNKTSKKWLEVSQVVCKAFMILKMHSGVVHRGLF
jgi:hypothetical protein